MSRWKQGDTKPDLVIDCFDGNGRRPDLTTATEVKVIVSQRGVAKWEREITDPAHLANGTVTVLLQEEDVATPGSFFVKVRAVWPDGTRQHYPPADQYLTMTVTR
jgi:hypothetical protein